MTTTALTNRFAESDFRIADSIRRALFILSHNSVMFGGLTVGVTLPTFVLNRLENTYPSLSLLRLLMMVVSPLAQAVIVHSALENMRRRPADLGTSFQFSIRRSVPLIGASIIYNVSVVLGFLALVVPGFMAMTVWFVAMPACLVEQTGSIASLKRSAQLTKSHRWKIFSVVLVMTLIWSASGIPEMVAAPYFREAHHWQAFPDPQEQVVLSIGCMVVPIWRAAALALNSALMAVVYHDLRIAKEGGDMGLIASVFE